MSESDLVTKGYLREVMAASEERLEKRLTESISRRVIDEMGKIFSDGLQLIANRFDVQDKEIAGLKVTVNRIENKLDATIEQVDDHKTRLKRLERRRSAA